MVRRSCDPVIARMWVRRALTLSIARPGQELQIQDLDLVLNPGDSKSIPATLGLRRWSTCAGSRAGQGPKRKVAGSQWHEVIINRSRHDNRRLTMRLSDAGKRCR